jgi:anti-sigma-K factor RskA
MTAFNQNLPDPDELDALAGEFVLGVLSEDRHAAVERELPRNEALRRAVYAWQDRMLAVAPLPDPVTPRADTWSRIAASIAPPAKPAPAHSVWANLAFWRWGFAAAAAATLAMTWTLWIGAPGPSERYVAILLTADNQAAWIVQADRTEVRLRPLTVARVSPQQALQFWTKPEGAAGPTSLGLVHGDGESIVPAAQLPALGANQLFEVTLEPAGGSPIGKPTGPVLALGRAVKL